MMFLEFAAKGAWFVVVAGHMESLGFSGRQISYVYATSSLGAIISPLLAGWIADRFLPAQRFAALCHFLAGAVMLLAWHQTRFATFWPAILLYAIITGPTVGLVNAISFHHIEDSRRFGRVRVWGSIGWMAVNWLVAGYLFAMERIAPGTSRVGDALVAGALLSFVMAVYCLTLPHTPPSREAKNPYAFLRSITQARNRNFAVLLVASTLAGAMLPFFYNLTFLYLTDSVTGMGMPESSAAAAITLGQLTEVLLMLLLVHVLRRLGTKTTMLLGLGALMCRGVIFALGRPLWLIVAAQTLHGFDYCFFFVASVIAAERLSESNLRASAQSLMVFATYGVGMLAGHVLSGRAYDWLAWDNGGHDWGRLFLLPLIIGVPTLLGLSVFFKGRDFEQMADGPGQTPPLPTDTA